MYCLYIPVLHVYVCMVCIVCIVCICMYLHVLYVLEIMYVCVCIVCICMYISKRFFRYIHIHAHTYIHTIQTKYRYVANACMCMYFRVKTYIIQTAGFTYIQIQTCRFPDAGRTRCPCSALALPPHNDTTTVDTRWPAVVPPSRIVGVTVASQARPARQIAESQALAVESQTSCRSPPA